MKMNGRTELRGRRYLCLVRCSTAQQTDTSIPDQLKLLRAFGDEHDLVHVDDVVLDGVSGSVPGARTDINDIIRRKSARDDFDVLLVQDMSRFTRGGAEHGMKLEYDLNAAGIDVIFVADHLPEGDHSGILKSVGFYAARQYAKSLSFATTRGSMSSLEQGRTAHCMRVPYGVDRLYISRDGKPLHVIRNLADGTQVKLHPDTGAVLTTYVAETGQGKSSHYRMQANERVVLIPGAPERIEVVRRMFRRRLIDGWGGFRIAKELNETGSPSGNGRPWCVSSVNHILRNPVYTGTGIANRYTSAIYNVRAKNAPKPSLVDRKALAMRGKPAASIRPNADWVEVEYPALKNLLGDLRNLAVAWQSSEIGKSAAGRTPKPANKDRHVNSPYVLKGIVRSKQGNHALTGRTVGRPGNKLRYYAVHRGFTVPKTDKTLRRLIPAEPLERAVIEIVRGVLASAPDLRAKIIRSIEHQRRKLSGDAGDIKKLDAERINITAQIELVIESLGTLGRAAAKSKLQHLEARLADLTHRIGRAEATAPATNEDANEIAENVINRLASIGQRLDGLPRQALRGLLQSLIGKLEVDMETRAVVIELALPDWSQISGFGGNATMCLENSSVRKSDHEAHLALGLRIAVFHCRSSRANRDRQPCWQCRRQAA